MNLLKTEIVNPAFDKLWDDVPFSRDITAPKPVLVLVCNCDEGSADDIQLKKMLDAARLNPDQYHVVRMHDEMTAWHKLREHLQPKIVFLIGVPPVQLGVSALFAVNAPNNFDDCIWLPTASISELSKHPEAKKQLWENGMKPLFIDKVYTGF